MKQNCPISTDVPKVIAVVAFLLADFLIFTYNSKNYGEYLMLPTQTCEWCDREIVHQLPKESGSITCAGCHRKIYGLWDEDCRQVILSKDVK